MLAAPAAGGASGGVSCAVERGSTDVLAPSGSPAGQASTSLPLGPPKTRSSKLPVRTKGRHLSEVSATPAHGHDRMPDVHEQAVKFGVPRDRCVGGGSGYAGVSTRVCFPSGDETPEMTTTPRWRGSPSAAWRATSSNRPQERNGGKASPPSYGFWAKDA